LTFDVEGLDNYTKKFRTSKLISKVPSNKLAIFGINKIMSLLRKYEITSTFFITGIFAENEPETVERIINAGHELACHGYNHENLALLSKVEIQNDIKKATNILESISNCNINGFRAPFCSTNNTILEVLEELNYLYDSSIHPTIIPGYYYNWNSPIVPYYPDKQNHLKIGHRKILEIPLSVIPYIHFPISWWWMRNFGPWITKTGTSLNLSRGYPVVLYFHSLEFMPLPKIDGVPFHMTRNTGKDFLYALDNFINKFRKYKFGNMRELASEKNTNPDA
jgi:hypothetical protein